MRLPRMLSLLALFLSLSVAGCNGNGPGAESDAGTDGGAADLGPRYLAFQIFEGTANPWLPFDTVVDYTPPEKIDAVVEDIILKVGTRGGDRNRLAFFLGPISFDHSDDEVRQIIDDGFAIARARGVAVGFHIDDSMFWSKRSDLAADAANVEWTDWDGTLSTGMSLDWAHPPRRMCLNAPTIRAEVTRRARDVIGAAIVAQLDALAPEDQHLFAGAVAGWETHMGQDVSTMDRVGFHALSNRGFSATNPPADVAGEVASIVQEFIGLWTSGLAEAGVGSDRIYTHVNFLPKARFDKFQSSGQVPPGVAYDQVVTFGRSSAPASVAFVTGARPGFTTYPHAGVFDQIEEERSAHGRPAWASAEGTNLIPGGAVGATGLTMEEYLARSFDHGATLVIIFGWGIGVPSQPNPFRTVTESADSIAAYRRFLEP